ncbi:MAG: hypothetical protein M1840_007571 [Geoglossum simile]|nr:MAG: hypothetical protein M1840_007571 [Geoglossum simile]
MVGIQRLNSSVRLLGAFGEKDETLESLHEEFRDELIHARKVYDKIEGAIRKYLKELDSSTEPGYDRAATELKVVLNYDEKEIGIKKVGLFFEAIKDRLATARAQEKMRTGILSEWESRPSYVTVKALCLLNPMMAFTEAYEDADFFFEGDTPFEGAAKTGATELVKVMIDQLLNDLKRKDPNPKTTSRKYLAKKRKSDSKTAFLMAAESLQLSVLQLLLRDYPDLADMDSVRATIQKTAPDPGRKNQNTALEAFKLIRRNMDVSKVDDAEIWKQAVNTPSLMVVGHLLKEAGPKIVTYENVKLIIEKGNIDMWNELDEKSQCELMSKGKCDLLHTAVKYRRVEIVENILKKFPKQIEVNIGIKGHEYAVQQLGKAEKADRISDPDSAYTRIRNALLYAMIRSTSPDLGIREIRSILRKSRVEADTICLHLSTIDTEEQSFTEYVQWLQSQKANMGRIFKFESILKYANFPDLNTQIPKHIQDVAASLRVDHTEIRIVFKWLRSRGVKQVLELSVPDRLLCPHSDDDVAYCVNGSAVRVLKWRKLDLYLGNLKDKNDLREIHLYSSGNRSVHRQWYEELKKFPNVRKLYVNVVTNVLSEKRVQKVKYELQEELDKLNAELKFPWTKRPAKEGQDIPRVPVAEFDWATDGRGRTYRDLDEITSDVVGPNLAAFVRKYRGATSEKDTHKTRVALIDSGVVIVGGKRKAKAEDREQSSKDRGHVPKDKEQAPNGGEQVSGANEQFSNGNEETSKKEESLKDNEQWWTNDLAKQVVDGKSFVSTGDDEEQVWWHASEPHGTQMARLICSIDPRCELYVAKVAETRRSGVSANVVAEAIQWAIEKEVDIISLSLVAYTDTDSMSQAIRDASAKDIVILSSTADEGVQEARDAIRKADISTDVFTIAACDRWGNLLDRSQKVGYDYRFVGNDVQVGQVPFLKSPESISGSSVATAIAAGTASLILACCRISEKSNTDGPNTENRWRSHMVRKTFNAMREGSDQNYVALENLCGKGRRLEDAQFALTVNDSFEWKWSKRG